MSTKKQVLAVVKAARESYEAAKTAGVRNPAPFGQVKLRFPRAVQTQRFQLAAGETWDTQFKNFRDDCVEIGCSEILFKRFVVVGPTLIFDPKAFEEWQNETPSCAQSMGCLCAAHIAADYPADAPCNADEVQS